MDNELNPRATSVQAGVGGAAGGLDASAPAAPDASHVDTGGPAFPVTAGYEVFEIGVTKRDWFAGQALVGMQITGVHMSAEDTAKIAYSISDAMLAERSKP